MKRVRTDLRPQDHTEDFGHYCLNALTPEYREVVEGASLDWLVAQYVRFADDTMSQISDIIATAISQHADDVGLSEAFRTAVEAY